jgi:RND family efflux transporter MFP subunit
MNYLTQIKIRPTFYVGLFIFFTCLHVQAGGNGPVQVQVALAVYTKMAPITWMPGTVIGKYDSKIAAEVDARIESLLDVGDVVEKGAVIARLDDTTYKMQLEEAQAEILPITARLEYLTRESERLEMLAQQNNAAKNRLDEIKSNRDEAKGELMIRNSRLAMARDKFKRTVITAPFPGVITERYKTEGEWVAEGDEIVRLVNVDKLEIQTRVSASNINHVSVGNDLVITDGTKKINANVLTLVPVGDNLSRLYEIRLGCQEKSWKTGHAVQVAIPNQAPQEVIAVPTDALVIRQNTIRVFRINQNNIAEEINVETGIASDHLIEVKGEINAGDLIVIRGNERLRPQQKVIIQEGASIP